MIRAPVRERFIELVELTGRLHGAPRDLVLRHLGQALLGNVALALDLPAEYGPDGGRAGSPPTAPPRPA